MSDSLGAVAVPLVAPAGGQAAGDKALSILLGYFAAFLNAHALTAWQAVAPGQQPVRKTLAHNPERHSFNEAHLPALYLFRQRGRPEDLTSDVLQEDGLLTLLWVFPPEPQAKQLVRDPMVNGLMKALEVAIRRGRDPAYVVSGDTDPTAPTYAADPDSIKTAVATSVSPQSYTGGALNGAIGAATMAPRRALTVTTAPAVGAYNVASPVVFTYTDWRDKTVTVSLQPTAANGGQTLTTTVEAKAVPRIDVPAQALATGSFEFGTAAVAGRGSVVIRHAGLARLRMVEWKPRLVVIRVRTEDDRDTTTTRTYEAVEATLAVREQLSVDLTDAARFTPHATNGPQIDFLHEDESVLETSQLPDAGIS